MWMLEEIEEAERMDNQETLARRLGTIHRSKTNTRKNTIHQIYCFDIIWKKLYQFVQDS